MSELIVLWGAGGHARVVADIISLAARYEIAGFIDDIGPERMGQSFCGAQVLGGQEQLPTLRSAGVSVALAAIGDCTARLRAATILLHNGFELATLIHPRATVAADVKVLGGTVIAAGAVVNPGTTIGQCVIVNTCASVDHDCRLADSAHVSPGAHLGGNVEIGQGTWIGIGAVICDGIKIGAGTIVGAGAVVVNDLPDGIVAMGVPARVIRMVSAK